MRVSSRFGLVAAAACLFAVEAAPAVAQYEGPQGHYGSEAAFTRSVNGTPCGINCTRASQRRWARYYSHHHHYRHPPKYHAAQ
jgi:hypothetical protein